MSQPATDQDIAEINYLDRLGIRVPVVHTTFGPRYLYKVTNSEKVSQIKQKSVHLYSQILEAIRTTKPQQNSKRDSGYVEVEGETYCWEFKYWDSTHLHFMPNGDRELVIAHDSEVD